MALATPDVTYSAQTLRQQAFQHILDGGDPNFEGKKVLELYQLAIDKAEKEYGPTAGYTAQLYFEMGNYAFDISNFGVANTGLTKALEINPNLSTARLRLAQLDEVCEKPDKAQDQMRQLLMRHGDNKVGQNRLIALMQKTNPIGATRQAYLFQHQESSTQAKLLAPPPATKPAAEKPAVEKPADVKPAAQKPSTPAAAPKVEMPAEKPTPQPAKKPDATPPQKVESTVAASAPSSMSSALLMRAHHIKQEDSTPPPQKPSADSADSTATVSAGGASSGGKPQTEDAAQELRIKRMKEEIQLYQQLKALQSGDSALKNLTHKTSKKSDSGSSHPAKKHKSSPPSDSSANIASSHSSEGHKSSHKSGGGSMLIPPPPPTGVSMPFPMAMPMPPRPDLMSPSIQIKTDAKIVKKPKPKPAAEAKASGEEKPAEAKVEKPPHVAPTGSADEDPEFLLKWAGTKKRKKE